MGGRGESDRGTDVVARWVPRMGARARCDGATVVIRIGIGTGCWRAGSGTGKMAEFAAVGRFRGGQGRAPAPRRKLASTRGQCDLSDSAALSGQGRGHVRGANRRRGAAGHLRPAGAGGVLADLASGRGHESLILDRINPVTLKPLGRCGLAEHGKAGKSHRSCPAEMRDVTNRLGFSVSRSVDLCHKSPGEMADHNRRFAACSG